MFLIGFPLLLIPFAIFNILVFMMPGVRLDATLASVTLMSQQVWTVTLSDAFLAVSIFLLLIEVVKAARPGAKFAMDHLLSLIVFGAATAEFLMLPQFASSTFFLLTALMFVDAMAGIFIGWRRRSTAKAMARSARSREPRAEAVPAEDAAAPPVV